LLANAHDQLLGKVLLERGMVAEGDLRRLYAESGFHKNNGNPVSLGQLLIHNRLLDPNHFQNLEQEIGHAGRSCGRCQQVFMKHPTAPEYCPGCSLPVARIGNDLNQANPRPLPAPNPLQASSSSSLIQSTACNAPGSGHFQAVAAYPQPAVNHLSGSFRMPANQMSPMAQHSGVMPAIPVPGMSPQQAAMLSGKFRMPLSGVTPDTASGSSQPPVTRPDSRPDGATTFGDNFAPGSSFHGHEILSELGRGGMGVVYKARNEETNEIVALKVLLAGEFASKKIIKRFKDEIAVLGNLDHPNIIPIRHSGEDKGIHFFTMGFVEGSGLDTLIKSRKVSLRRGLEIVATVCEAIYEAHEIDIVHRDLKPGNIMVDKKGIPYVMDFGLAKDLESNHSMTRSGVPIGTPYYMPPEQAKGDHKNIDERADIYALGAVLYEIITHRVPFKASTTTELMRMIIEEDPVPPRQLRPHCTPEYEAIALKALAKDVDDRYDTALDMADDLHAALAGKPIQAATSGLGSHIKRFVKKNKKAVSIVLATVIVSLLTCLFFYDRHLNQIKAEKLLKKQKQLESAAKDKKEADDKAEKDRIARDKEKIRLEKEKQEKRVKEAKLLVKLNELRSQISSHLERARSCRTVTDWRTHALRARRVANDLFQEAGESASARDYYLRGRIRQALGDFKPALKDYREAAESKSHRARGHFSYGYLKHLIDRNYSLAGEELDKAIPAQIDSNSEAEIEKEANQLATTLSQFLRNPASSGDGISNLPMTPTISEASYLRAKLHLKRAEATQNINDLAAAQRAVQTCLQRNQFDYFFATQAALVEIRVNASRPNTQSIKNIQKFLRRAEEINSQLPDAYEVRALLYAQLGKKSDAMMALQQAISKAKNKPHVLTELEDLRTSLNKIRPSSNNSGNKPSSGELQQSFNDFPPDRKLKEDDKTPSSYSILLVRFKPFLKGADIALWNSAMAALKANRNAECVGALKALLQKHPKHFKIRALLGHIYLERMKNAAGASKIFNELYKENPENVWIIKFMARLAIKTSKIPEAIKHLSNAIKKEPKDFECYYFSSQILVALKKYKEMEQFSIASLKVFPNNYNFLGSLTEAYIGQKRWKEAAISARKQLQRKKTITSILRTMFVIGAAKAFKKSDAPILADAQARFKNNGYITFAVGIYQMQHGNKAVAKQLLTAISKLDNPRLKPLAIQALADFK
jgi:serine/threonine protein kinase